MKSAWWLFMVFYRVLRNIMVENGLNNKTLLARLHVASELFYGVDETTLSRWLNNRTVPTLKRQTFICLIFGMSFSDILDNVNYTPKSKVLFKRLNNIFLDSDSYSRISYIPSDNSELKITDKVNNEQRNVIFLFYENFLCYRDKCLNRILNNKHTKVISVLQDGYNVPNSHLCYTILDEDLSILDGELVIRKQDIFLHLSYYHGFYEFVMLVGTFLIRILDNFDLVKSMDINVYSLTREPSFDEIYKKLDSELIFEKDSNGAYLALYKTSLFNIISDFDIVRLCKFSQLLS